MTADDRRAVEIPLWRRDFVGVFLVKMKNAFVPVKCDHSVNTYLRYSTVPRGSERSEWASPWTERASEMSVAKWSTAERVSGVSGVSNASEQTQRALTERMKVSGIWCIRTLSLFPKARMHFPHAIDEHHPRSLTAQLYPKKKIDLKVWNSNKRDIKISTIRSNDNILIFDF